MSKSLEDALSEGAWSVSAVIFDLDDKLDDEGRPISERRADVATRVGVEMEMRECPFSGIRQNQLMNVSALTQITQYYNPVLAEMTAFKRQTDSENSSWNDVLEGVIDLLAGPAIYLLQQRNSQDPVPAQMAVGHKLAAGMFGVMRGLYERLALGNKFPVTVDSFLDLVDEMGSLVGASEVCAGSPQMIRKASEALLEGNFDSDVQLDPLRFDLARCLALQVQLGIFWSLYDRVHLWSLLRGEFREHLRPCNDFLQRKIEHAEKDLNELAPSRPNGSMLPKILDPQLQQKLADALNDAADPKTLEEDVSVASKLLNEPGSPISYDSAVEPLAMRIANYLNTYRLFEAELSRVELELRGHLGFPLDTPIKLGAAVFPFPQALPWYELILGRRLGSDGHLTGKSTKVRSVT